MNRQVGRSLLAILIFTLGNCSVALLSWRVRELGIAVAFAPILWMVLHLAKRTR